MQGTDRSPAEIARSAKERALVVRMLTYTTTVSMNRPAGKNNDMIITKADMIFDVLYKLWEPYERTGLPLSQDASRDNVIQIIVTRVEDLFQGASKAKYDRRVDAISQALKKHKLWECDELRQEWKHTIAASHDQEKENRKADQHVQKQKTKDTAETPQEFDIDCLRGICVEVGNQVAERRDTPLRKLSQLLRCVVPMRGVNRCCQNQKSEHVITLANCPQAFMRNRYAELDTASGLTAVYTAPTALFYRDQTNGVNNQSMNASTNGTGNDSESYVVFPLDLELLGLSECPDFDTNQRALESLQTILQRQFNISLDGSSDREYVCTEFKEIFERHAQMAKSDTWDSDWKARSPMRTVVSNTFMARRYGTEAWNTLPLSKREATINVFLQETCGRNYCWLIARSSENTPVCLTRPLGLENITNTAKQIPGRRKSHVGLRKLAKKKSKGEEDSEEAAPVVDRKKPVTRAKKAAPVVAKKKAAPKRSAPPLVKKVGPDDHDESDASRVKSPSRSPPNKKRQVAKPVGRAAAKKATAASFKESESEEDSHSMSEEEESDKFGSDFDSTSDSDSDF